MISLEKMKKEPEKYVPKDTPYCYNWSDDCSYSCPFWDAFSMTREFADILIEDDVDKYGKIAVYDFYDLNPSTDTYEDLVEVYMSQNRQVYKCHLEGIIDIYQGQTLLWDMCKECGINDDYAE